MTTMPNKRGAGKGGTGVLWRVGRAWPALPDRDRWALEPKPVAPLEFERA